MRDCTCVGSCRGAKGLGVGWNCVVDNGSVEDARNRSPSSFMERPPSDDARLTPPEEGKASGSATESDLRTQIAHLTEEREGLKAELIAAQDDAQANWQSVKRLKAKLAALTEVHERLIVALKAAEQFIWPEISRGPAINGWQNTVDMVHALLSPREGTQLPKDQELTNDLTRRDTQTLSEGQPAASTDGGDAQ